MLRSVAYAPSLRARPTRLRSLRSFQEKGIEREGDAAHAFFAARAYMTFGRTFLCSIGLFIDAIYIVEQFTISFGKNIECAAKVTWQQEVCRAIIGLSKGEAWHMEPAEGAAARPPLVYISQS